jgi:hypothetical protein
MTLHRLHTPTPLKRAALVGGALAALAAGGSLALARSKPPMPRITSHPTHTSTRTSARFTLSDSQKRVRFYCAIDEKKFAHCPGRTSYTHVSDGTHTFHVKAMDGAGHASDTASYAWIVDHGAPRILITFPANGALLSAAAYAAGCSARGALCGTATDRVRISSISVSIRQNQTGRYWTGSSYGSAAERFVAAGLSTRRGGANWLYKLPLPAPDGDFYTVHVRARDALGNSTPPGRQARSTFTIDTTAPPAPTITSEPSVVTSETSASFGFTGTQTAGFQCRLDASAFAACASPAGYAGLGVGAHTFTVRALDRVGNVSPPASYAWMVQTGQGQPFGISGVAQAPLYPGGASAEVPLTLTNTASAPIAVTDVQARVSETSQTGCQAAWFAVKPASVPAAGIVVPANGTVTLPAQGATALSVQMVESHTNQDACQGATLTLTYTGSAHS